jgi:hypothetical protein
MAFEDFTRVGDLIPAELRETQSGASSAGEPALARPAPGVGHPEPARLLALVWSEAVGKEVAANSEPVHLQRGRLIVAASSSVWAQTLQFMEETIKSRVNERLGNLVVEHIQFRHAGWEERTRHTAPRTQAAVLARQWPESGSAPDGPSSDGGDVTARLSGEEEQALEAVRHMGLDHNLEETILRAMKAAFVRNQRKSVR